MGSHWVTNIMLQNHKHMCTRCQGVVYIVVGQPLMTRDTTNTGKFCPRAVAIELPETLGPAVFKRSGVSGDAVLDIVHLAGLLDSL